MSSALCAARACARTILWESLRLSAFSGAVPHVLLVVDRSPCALQKILLEGYLQELDAFNRELSTDEHVSNAKSYFADDDENKIMSRRAVAAALRIRLEPTATTPCFSVGLSETSRVTYGVLPFSPETFLKDVRALQVFLRSCGESALTSRWTDEMFAHCFTHAVGPLLAPNNFNNSNNNNNNNNNSLSYSYSSSGEALPPLMCDALRHGAKRELLGCILIQRNAFQNEMEKYRLRLDLFNMGLRVAEHCHLEIMSRRADAIIIDESSKEAADVSCCLDDDEIISYMRSCSFDPRTAESIGRAIADAIDAFSWDRQSEKNGPAAPVQPPAELIAAIKNKNLWKVYNEGALVWKNTENGADTSATKNVLPVEALPILGAGAPLRIVCRDGQTLTFSGGMEDCLLNTGYYAAANTEERNEVAAHRARFPAIDIVDMDDTHHNNNKNNNNSDNNINEEGEGSLNGAAEKRGRLKKKEFLAMRKEALLSEKAKNANRRNNSPTSHMEDGVARRTGGACLGNSIGGTFPVGEVISESFDLSKLNGYCSVFAYPNLFKEVTMTEPRPLTMRVENGIVTELSPDAPAEIAELIDLVRQVEGACYVRELGIGLNPFVGLQHVVSDVTSFERQFGVHLSLGQRHPLFVKQSEKRNADGTVAAGVRVDGPVLKRKAGKYHIDVFIDAEKLEMGDFVLDFTKGLAY